jgi:hypothetical protein
MRRGIEERLEFIEFRLFWEGRINRSDLMDRFKISTPQASKDLSLYESEAPGNLIYDTSAKRYFAAPNFQTKFYLPDAMPIPHRRVSVQVLRSVTGAIRNKTSLDIFYQSMNEQRPGAIWRKISPHALGHDGLRWHVRAFCHLDKRFKDFLLSRCLDSGDEHEAGVSPKDDKHWNEFFSVVLIPNPKLSGDQQAVISQDYCMEYGQIAIPVRKALLYYFRKRLRLDVAETLDDDREMPVVVLNQRAFEDAVAEAAPR